MFLPVKFQDIVHRSVIEDSEKIEGGRWQCEKGKWYHVGNECLCNIQMIEGDDGIIRLQEKAAPELSDQKREDMRNYSTSRYLGAGLKSF